MPVFGPLYQGDERARAALAALLAALQSRHAGAVDAVLFYGSCLRSGDLYDGLVDLYVIVRDYRSAHRSLAAAAANRRWRPTSTTCRPRLLAAWCAASMPCCRRQTRARRLARLVRVLHLGALLPARGGGEPPRRGRAGARGAALRTATITFLDRTLPASRRAGRLRRCGRTRSR